MEEKRDHVEESAVREAAEEEAISEEAAQIKESAERLRTEMYLNCYATYHMADGQKVISFLVGLRAADRDPDTIHWAVEQCRGELLNHKILQCSDGKGAVVLVNPAHVVTVSFEERLEKGHGHSRH